MNRTILIWGLSVKKLLLAVSVIALTSGAAFAADLAPAPVEPVAPVYVPYSWTGFYIGAQAGYGWSNSDVTIRNADGSLAGRSSADGDGAFGGGFAGYNYQFDGGFVVGAEADINGGDINSDGNAIITPGGRFPGISAFSKMDWFGSARLRVGYAFDRFLPFLTGGYAFGDQKAGFEGLFSASTSDTLSGWTVGAGLEYAITDHILTRIEYRYSDYGSQAGAVSSGGIPGSIDRDFKTNDIRVGVSYKF
jgi:outer membrane immunogenic protein